VTPVVAKLASKLPHENVDAAVEWRPLAVGDEIENLVTRKHSSRTLD
jgi:hypothetical protein